MRLQQLSVRNVRNIERAELSDLGDFNFVHGLNGSGKTSLLESIYTLSASRSFRSRKLRGVIRNDEDALVVRGGLLSSGGDGTDLQWLAVQRSRSRGAIVKYNNDFLRSAGELAGVLPVQLVNPESFSLVEGAPSVRRQFLDWSVFHVKHLGFYEAWLRYRKALQQRNSLLRRGKINTEILMPWSDELAKTGELITSCRQLQFDALLSRLKVVYEGLSLTNPLGSTDEQMAAFPDVELRFSPGWDSEVGLDVCLAEAFEGDARQGFTRYGPHRADIELRCAGLPAAEVLSRGQIKTLVCALKIAQCQLLIADGVAPVVLIDDLPAELDEGRCAGVFASLAKLGVQVFATSIQPGDLQDAWCGKEHKIKRFHVEHGRFASGS